MYRKILLVSANHLREPYPIYPIGISYIATYLRKHLPLLEMLTWDINLHSTEMLESLLKEKQPDYIGVSIRNIDGANSFDRTSFIPDYEQIVALIKKHSNAPLILGGAGFSLYAEFLFRRLQADYAIKGEGEIALTELIACLEEKRDYRHIEGLLYWEQGKVVLNPRRTFASKLTVRYDDDWMDYYWKHSGMLNIQTKRGCFYQCIYCSYPLIEGRRVRTLDIDEIVDNIERLQKEKNIDYIFFTDSLFNLDREKTMQLSEAMIRKNLNVRWAAYFSPSNLTDEEMALYKRSGLSHIEFGSESFSDIQLKNYGKSFTFDTILKTSELALKHNVFYAHFLILGGYGETEQTLDETFENSKQLRYTVLFPFVGMRIYPGTRLQEYAIRDGIVSADDPLVEPRYYISPDFNQATLKTRAQLTGKAWIFPGDIPEHEIQAFKLKRKKKGLIWEYLRKP